MNDYRALRNEKELRQLIKKVTQYDGFAKGSEILVQDKQSKKVLNAELIGIKTDKDKRSLVKIIYFDQNFSKFAVYYSFDDLFEKLNIEYGEGWIPFGVKNEV